MHFEMYYTEVSVEHRQVKSNLIVSQTLMHLWKDKTVAAVVALVYFATCFSSSAFLRFSYT